MTEEEWQIAIDPFALVISLRKKVSERKLRLFAVACCTRILHASQVSEYAREAIRVAEEYADGHATADQLQNPQVFRSLAVFGSSAAESACRNCLELDDPVVMADAASCNASWGIVAVGAFAEATNRLDPVFEKQLSEEKQHQTDLLRCIVGNPFRPATFTPTWRTEHAVGLSLRMYDGRDFAAMPILADAIEEAGCDNADVLTHCREPGPHARGCWVVDGVLGKL